MRIIEEGIRWNFDTRDKGKRSNVIIGKVGWVGQFLGRAAWKLTGQRKKKEVGRGVPRPLGIGSHKRGRATVCERGRQGRQSPAPMPN